MENNLLRNNIVKGENLVQVFEIVVHNMFQNLNMHKSILSRRHEISISPHSKTVTDIPILFFSNARVMARLHLCQTATSILERHS